MKLVLLLLTVACSFACLARTWSVAELPPGGFADTEAATNVVVAIPADKNRLTLSLTVDCTPSNSVEVARSRFALRPEAEVGQAVFRAESNNTVRIYDTITKKSKAVIGHSNGVLT